jgi:hypothetical protein
MCFVYAVTYAISCISQLINSYWVLMVGWP